MLSSHFDLPPPPLRPPPLLALLRVLLFPVLFTELLPFPFPFSLCHGLRSLLAATHSSSLHSIRSPTADVHMLTQLELGKYCHAGAGLMGDKLRGR